MCIYMVQSVYIKLLVGHSAIFQYVLSIATFMCVYSKICVQYMLRLFGSLTTPTFWPLVVMLTHHAHSNFSRIIKLTHNSKKFNKILVSRAKLPELLLFRNYGFYSN